MRAANLSGSKNSKTNKGRGLQQTFLVKGNAVEKHASADARYVTVRGKEILIEQLSSGMWRPRFKFGGNKLPLGVFTNFNDAEFSVVRYIKQKEKAWMRGIYPDKYRR